jgi:ketosteroid isomerase-like protein
MSTDLAEVIPFVGDSLDQDLGRVSIVRPSGTASEVDSTAARTLRFVKDLNTKDTERLRGWFGDHSELWIPPSASRTGAARITQLFRVIFAQYAELRWTPERCYIVDPQTVITQMTSEGSFRDGRSYKNRVAMFQTFAADGTIARQADYFEDTSIFTPRR